MEQNDLDSFEKINEEEKILELKKIVDESFSKDMKYFSEPVQNFFKMMQNKYPIQELQKCKLWHVLILSTRNGTETRFDMPEGEIEYFIRNNL